MGWLFRRAAAVALMGLAFGTAQVDRAQAVALAPGILGISADVKAQFEAELQANRENAFQVYQNFLTNYPGEAIGLTAVFLKGREEFAASVGAAATIALMGSWANNQVIGKQIEFISQYLGNANPKAAIATFSAMSAAAPQLGKVVLAGLVSGAPDQAEALRAAAASQGTKTLAEEDEPPVASGGVIAPSAGTDLIADPRPVGGATTTNPVVCLSPPCG